MKEFLHIGHADELQAPGDRRMYRFFEILPGILAWSTLILIVVLSFISPVIIAIFIILFDIYWLLKSIFVALHMRSGYNLMKKNLQKDWLAKLAELSPRILYDPQSSEVPVSASDKVARIPTAWKDMYHLIILPMATEPLDVVRESFRGLVNTKYPLDRFIVVLAIEERVGESAKQIAKSIEQEFGNKFFRFLISEHPDGIKGEIRGKGSNETHAGKLVKENIIDPLEIFYERIIVSVFDIDTIVPEHFFGCLTWNFLTAEHPLHSSYQPIPIFNNNIWQAPAFSRVFAFSTTFWQMIQQARPERLVTFSSQSISFKALVDVGFWQTNVVSEDSRIYWQCLLRYDGNWRTVPLAYPVYMDANVAPTFMSTMKNQYRQIRRWAWGVENNPYFLFGFLKNKKMSLWQKWHIGSFMIESGHSLATNAIIIFLLGWLPVIVGGPEFNKSILSFNLPNITRDIMNIAMLGLISSAIISINLLPPRPPNYGRFKYVLMLLQWLLFPLNVIFFGAVPALDAQTRLMLGRKWRLGFWVTPKSRNP